MKIVFLGGNFNNSGGTERVTSIVANGLARAGHEVVIVSVEGGDNPFFSLDQEIKVVTLFKTIGRKMFRTPSLIIKVRKILLTERVDAIIVVETMLALFTIPATRGLLIKHICWEHFNFKFDLGRVGRRVARQFAARFCDVVVTLTERDRGYWRAGTKHKSAIVTIPNPSPFSVQLAHMPPENSKVVLAAGRLVHQKGFDMLLESWAAISPLAPEWRLRIVGNGPDREALTQLAFKFGIENAVDFVSATPDIEQHYRQAAIYCLSSRFEGFGMVLVEAMSYGIPSVSFDCDAGPEELLAGTGAILVPPNNIEELNKALLGLMHDPVERKRIGVLSKIKAEQYQPKAIMPRWLEILE